jgi:hypothetical protein
MLWHPCLFPSAYGVISRPLQIRENAVEWPLEIKGEPNPGAAQRNAILECIAKFGSEIWKKTSGVGAFRASINIAGDAIFIPYSTHHDQALSQKDRQPLRREGRKDGPLANQRQAAVELLAEWGSIEGLGVVPLELTWQCA